MVTKPASGNAGATFAKLAEAYETLALIHSKASGTPMPPKKVVIKRDPNEPKKPPSAYILFLHDKRLEIKDKQPDDTPSEVMAKTFEAWSTISDDERRRYEELAAAAKKEYVEELAKYKAEHGTPPVESEKEEEEEEEDDVPEPVAPVVAPSKAIRPKKTKDSDTPVKTVPKLDEPKKKTKDSDIPAKTVADKDEPKKKTELATSNGAAPEKRKKKSSSAGGPAPTVVAENGGEHHDSEKKKKKKKSHKSKHSESQ